MKFAPNKRYIKTNGTWGEVTQADYTRSGLAVPSVYSNAEGELGYASCDGHEAFGDSWVEEVKKWLKGEDQTQADWDAEPSELPGQDVVEKTIAERGLVYGDPYLSHLNIALSWTALLQQHLGITFDKPLPASLVAQMMVVFKMQRSAKVYKDDNYVDAHAYAKFADEFQKKEQTLTKQ